MLSFTGISQVAEASSASVDTGSNSLIARPAAALGRIDPVTAPPSHISSSGGALGLRAASLNPMQLAAAGIAQGDDRPACYDLMPNGFNQMYRESICFIYLRRCVSFDIQNRSNEIDISSVPCLLAELVTLFAQISKVPLESSGQIILNKFLRVFRSIQKRFDKELPSEYLQRLFLLPAGSSLAGLGAILRSSLVEEPASVTTPSQARLPRRSNRDRDRQANPNAWLPSLAQWRGLHFAASESVGCGDSLSIINLKRLVTESVDSIYSLAHQKGEILQSTLFGALCLMTLISNRHLAPQYIREIATALKDYTAPSQRPHFPSQVVKAERYDSLAHFVLCQIEALLLLRSKQDMAQCKLIDKAVGEFNSAINSSLQSVTEQSKPLETLSTATEDLPNLKRTLKKIEEKLFEVQIGAEQAREQCFYGLHWGSKDSYGYLNATVSQKELAIMEKYELFRNTLAGYYAQICKLNKSIKTLEVQNDSTFRAKIVELEAQMIVDQGQYIEFVQKFELLAELADVSAGVIELTIENLPVEVDPEPSVGLQQEVSDQYTQCEENLVSLRSLQESVSSLSQKVRAYYFGTNKVTFGLHHFDRDFSQDELTLRTNVGLLAVDLNQLEAVLTLKIQQTHLRNTRYINDLREKGWILRDPSPR
jgi:hypothetical protein